MSTFPSMKSLAGDPCSVQSSQTHFHVSFKKRLWSPQMFLHSTFRSYSDAKIWVFWKNYFLLLCEYCYWNWKCLWVVFRQGVQGDGSCKYRVENRSSSQAKYEYLNLNSSGRVEELSRECDSAKLLQVPFSRVEDCCKTVQTVSFFKSLL